MRVIGANQPLIAARNMTTSANIMAAAGAKQAAAMERVGRASKTVGLLLLAGIGAGLALSAKAAIEFESSFAGIRKTVDTSEAGFQRLSDTMRSMAKQIPVNVNDLNKIGELAGQLGVQADNIGQFTDTIAKIGVSTNLSTDQAAQGFARLANIMQVPQNQFDKMGSTIVDLGNNFATTEDQILTFALRVAPVGQTVGLTADQVIALGTAFSSVGVPAERGGTAVQRTFIQMEKAVKSGGDELKAFADTAGTTVGGFQTMFEQDAAHALDVFLQGLVAIDAEGGNMFTVLDRTHLASSRTANSLLALANAGGLLTDALQTGNQAWNDNVALNEEAAKRFDTTASKLQVAKNRMQDLSIEMGEKLLPAVGKAAQDFSTFIEMISGSALAGVGLFVIKMTAMVGLFVGIGIAATKAIKLFKDVGLAVQLLTTKFIGLNVAAAPVVGLFAALAAIIGVGFLEASIAAKERTQEFTDAINSQTGAIEDNLDALRRKNLADAAAKAGFPISKIGDSLKDEKKALDEVINLIAFYNDRTIAATSGEIDLSDAQFKAMQIRMRALGELRTQIEHNIEAEEKALEKHRQAIWLLPQETDTIFDLNKIYHSNQAAAIAAGKGIKFYADQLHLSDEELALYADGLKQINDQLAAQIDPAYDLADAYSNYLDAVDAFNQDKTVRNMTDLQKAWSELQTAAKNLGGDGIQSVIAGLEQMAQKGIITQEDAARTERAWVALGTVGNQVAGTVVDMNLTYTDLSAITQENTEATAGLIARIYGLDVMMARSINTAQAFAQAMFIATHPEQAKYFKNLGIDAVTAQVGMQIGKNLTDILDLAGGDAGKAWGKSFGGSAGAAATSAMNDFVGVLNADNSYQQALRSLAEATKKIDELQLKQITIAHDIAQAERDLAKARIEAAKVTLEEEVGILRTRLDIFRQERDLYDMRKEQAGIPQAIADQQERLVKAEEEYQAALIRADRIGREHEQNMTALQADIVRRLREYAMGTGTFADLVQSEQDLAEELTHSGDAAEMAADAQEQYQQTQVDVAKTIDGLMARRQELTFQIVLAEKELILTRRELAQQIVDSTGPTQEVLDLEDQLNQLREDQTQTTADLTQATWDLQSAQLAVVSTYQALQAASEGLDPTAAIAYFRRIASEAGLSAAAVDNLVSKYRQLGVKTTSGSRTVSTSGGGTVSSVNVGGVISTPTIDTTTTPSIPTRTPTTPTIVGGGYQILDQGGVVQGPTVGTPMPILAHVGETVLTPGQFGKMTAALGQTAGGATTIIVQIDGEEVSRYVVDDVAQSLATSVRTARRVN